MFPFGSARPVFTEQGVQESHSIPVLPVLWSSAGVGSLPLLHSPPRGPHGLSQVWPASGWTAPLEALVSPAQGCTGGRGC